MLSYHAGVTMQVLAELTATPLFYYRLAIQDKPFAAPLRLIAAGLDLHSLPLAPPPFKQEGLTCVPILLGTDTHSTAAAQALMHCYAAETHMGLLENVLPPASSAAANQSMIARPNSNVVIRCSRATVS